MQSDTADNAMAAEVAASDHDGGMQSDAADNAMAAEVASTPSSNHDGGTTMVKMAEMPAEYLRWVLAQDKEDYRVPTLEDYSQEELDESRETICTVIASLETAYNEFDEFRAWVSDVLEKGGVVMISEDMLFSDPQEWQESADQEWAEAHKELMETTGPLGPHLYMMSVYLALTYKYAAPIPMFWGA